MIAAAAAVEDVVSQQCRPLFSVHVRRFSLHRRSSTSRALDTISQHVVIYTPADTRDPPPSSLLVPALNNLQSCVFSRYSANKIVISNVPSTVRFEQLDQILLQFGQVKDIEKLSQRDGPTQVIQITFESTEQAHK